jgi:NADH dehydrogenase [ubiquinone] 1 alpha subcomplex assembly factor 5
MLLFTRAGCLFATARRICSGRAAVRKLIHVDSSQAQLDAVAAVPAAPGVEREFVCADEEQLPLAHGSVDLVVSCLGLHWLNDLPGAMVQCRRTLRPDGLFLSAFLGGCVAVCARVVCAMRLRAQQRNRHVHGMHACEPERGALAFAVAR